MANSQVARRARYVTYRWRQLLTILVTGGAGYIGSHATLALLQTGHDVVVIDNLCNSSAKSLERVSKLAGRSAVLIQGDVRDSSLVEELLRKYSVQAVLHFAGLKAVGESGKVPLKYYENNVLGSLALMNAMAKSGVFSIVFSSSATVYGEPENLPISESHRLDHPTSPYGRSKLMVEDILRDLSASDQRWRIAILRYFNPVGAHASGLIGEDAISIPNNLLPYVSQVAIGNLPELVIFGNDYPTPDGTGIRDYIHVMDLVDGHLRALQVLKTMVGAHVWNLGTGRGYSVLEVIRAFEVASGKRVPFRIAPRRQGDVAISCADPSKAHLDLGWKASRNLSEMVRDAWCWQEKNPAGYSR